MEHDFVIALYCPYETSKQRPFSRQLAHEFSISISDKMSQIYALASFLNATHGQPLASGPHVNHLDPHTNTNIPTTYGYYSTFQSRAQPNLDSPPSYEKSQCSKPRLNPSECEILPAYSASVDLHAVLSMKRELSTPFTAPTKDREWSDVYAVLRGTCLSLHRIKRAKAFAKDRSVRPGKLVRQYSLQHAEVGIAMDHQKSQPVPKHYLGYFIPPLAREKAYESDPHLFEPVREHVLRLRPEGEQILLCAWSQPQLLDWVEKLCEAIDISQPLEDRAEPRYRSLPRRGRRQRQLEASLLHNVSGLSESAAGRRHIEEQERILRELYPNLGESSSESTSAGSNELEQTNTNDPDTEDLDPADVRDPSPTPPTQSPSTEEMEAHESYFPAPELPEQTTRTSFDDPEPAEPPRRSSTSSDTSTATATTTSSIQRKPIPRSSPSAAHILRYRKRCAPVLLATSPRNNDVIFHEGARMRINPADHTLVPFVQAPPKYESHKFPLKVKRIPLPPSMVAEPLLEDVEDDGDGGEERAAVEGDGEEGSPSSSRASSQLQHSVPGTPDTEHDLDFSPGAVAALDGSNALEPSPTRDTIESVKKDSLGGGRLHKGRKWGSWGLRGKDAETRAHTHTVVREGAYFVGAAWGG